MNVWRSGNFNGTNYIISLPNTDHFGLEYWNKAKPHSYQYKDTLTDVMKSVSWIRVHLEPEDSLP